MPWYSKETSNAYNTKKKREKERKREKGKKNKRKISRERERERERVISKVIRVMREKGADEQKGMGD